MDIGKIKLQVPQTYSGEPDSTLADTIIALGILSTELAVTAGFATIVTGSNMAKGIAAAIVGGVLLPADASLGRPAVGIVVNGATAGQKARIMLGSGYVAGLSGLTANTTVYLGTAGALLFTRPTAGLVQAVGYALTTTELFVMVASGLAPASPLAAQVTITPPSSGVLEWTETVTFPACTAATIITATLATPADTAENDPEFLSLQSLSVVALTGQATITVSFNEITSGPILINLHGV